jgi:hypothetical protein
MGSKILTLISALILATFTTKASPVKVKITNQTKQAIVNLEYWIGSNTESQNSTNLPFMSKGLLQADKTISLTVDFKSDKRNTLVIRGNLSGGGYVQQKYTISDKHEEPEITLQNVAQPINTEAYKIVMDQFSELKISDSRNVAVDMEVALNALIGSITVYRDSTYKEEIYKLAPRVLGTRVSKVSQPAMNKTIKGTFSSESSVKANVVLPFVSVGSAFEFGDVAKFSWEVEDVGTYIWSSDNGQDLAQLFSKLPEETKKILVNIYMENPKARMKFFDKAFAIGRINMITDRTKKILTNVELNAANYVTGNGNYLFVDDLQQKSQIKQVVSQIEGYDVTIFLSSLYLDYKTQNLAANTTKENERIKSEYNFLRTLNPELQETQDISIMKKALEDLFRDPKKKISFIKEGIKTETIDPKSLK